MGCSTGFMGSAFFSVVSGVLVGFVSMGSFLGSSTGLVAPPPSFLGVGTWPATPVPLSTAGPVPPSPGAALDVTTFGRFGLVLGALDLAADEPFLVCP